MNIPGQETRKVPWIFPLIFLLLAEWLQQSEGFGQGSIPQGAGRQVKRPCRVVLKGWLDNFLPKPVDDAERRKDYPEQYPATYEANDAVVSSDTEAVRYLVRPLLKQTQLESRPMQLVYDANRDGWNAQSFHTKVDGKGAAVVVARTKNQIVGGYNPKGWSSNGGARPSIAAFLFYSGIRTRSGKSISTGKDGSVLLQKLRKVGGGGLACGWDDPDSGIAFGPDALLINLQPGREQSASSKLGPYFERGPEDRDSIFDAGADVLTSLEVYTGLYQSNEEIPYSGAVLDMTSG